MALEFETADVFTDRRFGGNPLAVVHDAAALDTAAMQAIARTFNLSETVFVLGVEGDAAAIRIFTPARELPFAGHPNVGAAVLLARRHGLTGDALHLSQPAGVVAARLHRDAAGAVTGAEIEAPLPLALGAALDPAAVAACAGLDAAALHVTAQPPVVAGCGTDFAIAEMEDVAALAAAAPDAGAFRAHLLGVTGLLLHAPLGPHRRRARMFGPLAGVVEDPATGSANLALAGLLLHLAGGESLWLEVEQGVEMGRPSLLSLHARRDGAGAIRARVGGGVVPFARGTLLD